MDNVRVLVADDEKNLVALLKEELSRAGFNVLTASNGKEAIRLLEEKGFDVCLLDINMPHMNGVEVLKRASLQAIPTEFIIITVNATVSTAVETMKLGAYDYVMKPCSMERLIFLVKKAYEKRMMKRETLALKRFKRVNAIVTGNSVLLKLLAEAKKAAKTDANILIMGESGTGKNLIAEYIHENSPRSCFPLMSFNVAAIQSNLIESELFGYEKGAFTGAVSAKAGLFELADRSTVFLDEIGDIPPQTQVKLLRAIETGSFFKVGGTKEFTADLRVVSATNRNLHGAVKQGRFREDLFYRLSTMIFTVPPLRERKDDIPLLAGHILSGLKLGHKKTIDGDAMDMLVSYDWPGNVRELQNVLYRAAILSDGERICSEYLPSDLKSGAGVKDDAADLTIRGIEAGHIRKMLACAGGHRKKAAEMLGIDAKTLWRKIKEYGLE